MDENSGLQLLIVFMAVSYGFVLNSKDAERA